MAEAENRDGLIKKDAAILNAFRAMVGNMGDYAGWLEIRYDKDQNMLVLEKTGEKVDNPFEAISPIIPEKDHRFYIFKSPLESEVDHAGRRLFILVHWGPDQSPVKTRMMYASARGEIKSYLGNKQFVEDLFASRADEIDLGYYERDRDNSNQHLLRTADEVIKAQVEEECMPVGVATPVLKQMKVKLSDEVPGLLNQYKEGEIDSVLMNMDQKNEGLVGKAADNDFEELKASLDGPCFILHKFKHVNPENENVGSNMFIYFSPTENKDRRTKFTYSLTKTNAKAAIEDSGIKIEETFEVGGLGELENQKLLDALYLERKQKVVSAKPQVAGAKKAKKKKKKRAAALDDL